MNDQPDPTKIIVLAFMTSPAILTFVGWTLAGQPPLGAFFGGATDAGWLHDPITAIFAMLSIGAAIASLLVPMRATPNAPAQARAVLLRVRVIMKAAAGEIAAVFGFVSFIITKTSPAPLLFGAVLAEVALLKLLVIDLPSISNADGSGSSILPS